MTAFHNATATVQSEQDSELSKETNGLHEALSAATAVYVSVLDTVQ